MEVPLTVSESHDGRVPKTLEHVVHCIQDHVCTPTRNQLISGLFYVLMQECGYILMQPLEYEDANPNNVKNFDGLEKRTMTFNVNRLLSQAPLVAPLLVSPNGPYKLPLHLVGVESYRFKLLVAPSADDLVVVNLLVTKENLNDCFSIVLRVPTFVPNPKAENVADKFFDLRTLSVIFKDNIAHKGRSAVLNSEGMINNSLVGLMDEVKLKIVKVLPVSDMLNLAATCQSMQMLKRDQSVWKTLLWRDFHYVFPEDEDQSVDNLIATYRRLWTKFHTVDPWNDEIDAASFTGDDFSIDSETDPGVIPRSPSFDFHPYFIMNVNNEVYTTNTLAFPQRQFTSMSTSSHTYLNARQYYSHTHLQNRHGLDPNNI